MTEVSALFWDIGGVLLTNGWDRASRRRAAERFELAWEDFQERHELVIHEFETGRISLDSYLTCTVFHRERPFTPQALKAFMFAESALLPGALELVGRLSKGGRYLMGTLNNESLELNLHRIEQFGLRDHFSLFISSCFVGHRKPELEIYRLALNISQREPAECVFIDDRTLNVERACDTGIRAIHYQAPDQLVEDLEKYGVSADGQWP